MGGGNHVLTLPPGIRSAPPPGAKEIKNIYITVSGKLKIVYEDGEE